MRAKHFGAAVLAAVLMVCMMSNALALSKSPSASYNQDKSLALAAIQTKTDRAYNEKIISGEFKQMMASIIDPLTNAEAMVTYYVGDCDNHAIRPAFFSVTRMQPDSGDIPTDEDYLRTYVWNVPDQILENAGLAFINPKAEAAYNREHGYPEGEGASFAPYPIHEYQDGYGVDITIFSMVAVHILDEGIYADMDLSDTILYNEMFALFRICDNLYGFPTDYCYLITDQDDVYEIMDILDISEHGHFLGAKWMKWYR